MKRAKRLIRRYLDKWLKPLGLLWWEVRAYYVEKPAEVLEHLTSENNEVAARAFVDWRYSTAVIYFNVPLIATMKKDEIEGIVIHELVHVLINEMREKEIHHEERVVTALTKAFGWVFESGRGK